MNYPPYSQYKPSGVEWLGGIPAHWEVKRLKFIAYCSVSNVDKKSVDGDEPVKLCNYVDVYHRECIDSSVDFMVATATILQIDKFTLMSGDVLITKDSESPDDIAVPAVVTEELNNVICGYHLAQLRPMAALMDGRYLARALSAHGVRDHFWSSATGITRFGLTLNDIGTAPVPTPPILEQKAIADFLDRETDRIDCLIAKKREFIDRLKEKRAALITQAVTRGLDPDVPMKDTGVAWLGEVPTHWEVKPIKYLAQVGNGSTPNRDNEDYWWGGMFPWLNSAVVNHEQVNEGADFVTDLALQECHLPIVNPPAVLIGITGQGKTRGMATTLKIVATINQHLAYMKPIEAISSTDYLRRVMDVAYAYLRSESDGGGSTKGAITCEQISHMKIPVPPLIEQEAITTELGAKLVATSNLIAKVESAIERLIEYRSALITAAVTGKIDVRNPQREAA